MSAAPELLEGVADPSAGEASHVYVHPGQLFFTAQETVVTTVLGSCVAVCIYDCAGRAGGINHYLLPVTFGAKSPRFADVANAMLLERFVAAGIPAGDLRAKVFGGAAMGMIKSDLAERNVAAALDFLTAEQIVVEATDLGGSRGRKVHFRTSDGAVALRLL